MELKITQPNDTQQHYTCNIRCETFNFPTHKTVSYERSAKDPIQAGLERFWRNLISPRKKGNHHSSGVEGTIILRGGARINKVTRVVLCLEGFWSMDFQNFCGMDV